jgi:DNA-binding NarL/FixJ family response regulator
MENLTDNQLQIIIADDHQLFAEGLENLLTSTGRYRIIAKVSNGKKLLQVLNSQTPDLILLDINMPNLSGMDAALTIRKNNPRQKIVFITMYHEDKLLQFCKEHLINGYLLKVTTATEVKDALQRIVQGEYVYANRSSRLQKTDKDTGFADNFINKLKISKRELEIIGLIKTGYTSKEIAAQLFLSEFTVETHRRNIFRKLNVTSIGALLNFAHENNI